MAWPAWLLSLGCCFSLARLADVDVDVDEAAVVGAWQLALPTPQSHGANPRTRLTILTCYFPSFSTLSFLLLITVVSSQIVVNLLVQVG